MLSLHYQRFSAADIRMGSWRVTDACCQSLLLYRSPLLFLTSGKLVVSVLHSIILNCFPCHTGFLKTQACCQQDVQTAWLVQCRYDKLKKKCDKFLTRDMTQSSQSNKPHKAGARPLPLGPAGCRAWEALVTALWCYCSMQQGLNGKQRTRRTSFPLLSSPQMYSVRLLN